MTAGHILVCIWS